MKDVKRKYQTFERNVYYDTETCSTWQPALTQLFDLDKARLIVINRWFYLSSSFRFQTASESQKPICLSKMVDISNRLVALLEWHTNKDKEKK